MIIMEDKEDEIIVKVKDNGCGIDKENLDKIIKTFFTTKSVERGTGIGLTTVKSIVENDLKGKIEASSKKKDRKSVV